MENQYHKIVIGSYVAMAALVGYIVFTVGLKLIGIYDLEARIPNAEILIRVASVAVGAILFFVLYRHDQTNQFVNEVVVELSRVTWPTQKETTSATIVVMIMVIVSGIALGLLDYFWTMVLKWIL
jgi:preprotein translocase subunit SecE